MSDKCLYRIFSAAPFQPGFSALPLCHSMTVDGLASAGLAGAGDGDGLGNGALPRGPAKAGSLFLHRPERPEPADPTRNLARLHRMERTQRAKPGLDRSTAPGAKGLITRSAHDGHRDLRMSKPAALAGPGNPNGHSRLSQPAATTEGTVTRQPTLPVPAGVGDHQGRLGGEHRPGSPRPRG